jgi:hypothetical protein
VRAVPYLCVAGYEVANDNRTLTYVRRTIPDPRLEVSLCGEQSNGTGYSDTYVDEYLPDPFWPGDLCCYCRATDDSNDGLYVSPEADDAPWYEPARPASADYLGIMSSEIHVESVLARSVTPRSGGGATVGQLRPLPRTLTFTGVMVAASPEGMAYGERWLTDVLSGSLCAPGCPADDAVILPACPPDTVTTDEERLTWFRTLAEVGIGHGPVFAPVDAAVPDCLLQQVTFTLVAGIPHLLGEPECCDSGTVGAGGSLSCVVTTDDWVGDAAVRITITAATAVSGLAVAAVPLADPGDCGASAGSPCATFTVDLDRGDTLTIDAARRRVDWLDVTDKQTKNGMRRLTYDGLLDWIDVPPCSNVCVTVTGGTGTAEVSIERVVREL